MSSRRWVFLFLSVVYVGCAGQAPPVGSDPKPAPTEPAQSVPLIPDPPLARTPEPEPPRSLEVSMRDQVVELGYLSLDDAAHVLVLGRRTLSLIRVEATTVEMVHQVDLLANVDSGARLQRRAQGCLQFLAPPDQSAAPWLHLFSTGLGFPEAGSAAFRVLDGTLIPQEPGWLDSEGNIGSCDAFQEAMQYGWPGRALVLLSAAVDPVFVHLTRNDSLSITALSGEERVLIAPSGELLTAAGSPDEAYIYASSPSLPGEPDHVLEYYWDGRDLDGRRRSREFSGRLAAMMLLPGDGRSVVAQTDPSGSLLHILRREDLWQEAAP